MSIDGTLIDDGTMDTVIECHCDECGKTWEERFSDTSDYRDNSGAFLGGENELLESFGIYCECEE